ncbi:putative membrane protein DUF2157 [Kribbella sp. VKM Ac-2571]|uniref:DUF2157 domain-containing protein n=1 Tax=Kribbella sp. VKM Ac-2571 TaxID=2512222 RepID=UPI0010D02945|nr:DUF2157 domain-containing protein [Kribbella sp. VKM Ac-2571]TDO48353.1 putative membrane protein DUF2157 [Kribbella sp. VKM Ac-2571]
MRASIDGRPALPNVPDLIDRWLAEGVITPAQADRMRADVGAPGARQPDVRPTEPSGPETALQRSSLVAEGLAYLGGVIVLVAAGLICARYWASMPQNAQLGVVGGTAAGLLLAGGAIPRSRSGAGVRLRSVLWLLSTAGAAAFAALFAHRVLELDGSANVLVTGSVSGVLAAALWWRLPVLAQQAAFFVATMVTAGAAVAQLTSSPHVPGLAVWGIGVIWFLLGWLGTVKPRRPVLALAAIAALIGAAMTLPADAGMVLALCTVVALVVVAVVIHDLLLLAVGAVGALNILPAVVNEWFPGDLAAPLVLLGVGALLVTAAVYTANRPRTHHTAG